MKQNLKYQWNQLNILLKLVVVNLAVFILIVTIQLFSFLFSSTFIINTFIELYLLSGFAGAIFFFLAYNIFPVFGPFKNESILLGASAAISGIVIAASAYKPNDNIYLFGLFKVPLWIIGALYVLYDLSMLPI